MANNELVLFETQDKHISLNVPIVNESVWLNRNQMAELFGRDVKTIGKHIGNALREEVDPAATVAKFATVQKEGDRDVERLVEFYNLDVIISVGYRVKSQRGVEFRRWANTVLRQYILQGYAVNHNRIKELGEVIRIMKRTQNALDAQQVLSVIERYNTALDLLDDYDHQTMQRPKGNAATHRLTYEECRELIAAMRFGSESDLFGNEKDDSFKGSIGNIYQSFGGQEVYPSMEEKAANLLYFDADYKRELYSTKNPTLDTFWGTLIFEERFKQRILVTTSVLDCGINVKDDALTNIVIGTSDRTEFIQMLGRKRINSKTKKIDVWVLRPSERSLRKWKRKYKEVIALADERLAAQNIGEKLGIAWRVWNHPDPLAHALFYPSTDGILEVNLTAMVTYERRHYFLEQLLREPLSDVQSRFEQLVISWLGLRPEDVDQTIEKTQTERLNNLSTFLEHNVGKAMTESQKEEFIQLLTIALELANVKSSVRNRSMGSSACSNRLEDLGLQYMIKPKSGVWTIEEKD